MASYVATYKSSGFTLAEKIAQPAISASTKGGVWLNAEKHQQVCYSTPRSKSCLSGSQVEVANSPLPNSGVSLASINSDTI